jgi:hypothetical protein
LDSPKNFVGNFVANFVEGWPPLAYWDSTKFATKEFCKTGVQLATAFPFSHPRGGFTEFRNVQTPDTVITVITVQTAPFEKCASSRERVACRFLAHRQSVYGPEEANFSRRGSD